MDINQILKDAPFYIAAGIGIGLLPYVYFNYIVPPTKEEIVNTNPRRTRPERLIERISEELGLRGLEPALVEQARYRKMIGFLWFGYAKRLEKDGLNSEQIEHLIRLRKDYTTNRYGKSTRREARTRFFRDESVVRPYLLIVNPARVEISQNGSREDLTARLS